jgi:regulator of replication initiation timing
MVLSPGVSALIEELRQELAALRAENAALKQENAELRRRLGHGQFQQRQAARQ